MYVVINKIDANLFSRLLVLILRNGLFLLAHLIPLRTTRCLVLAQLSALAHHC